MELNLKQKGIVNVSTSRAPHEKVCGSENGVDDLRLLLRSVSLMQHKICLILKLKLKFRKENLYKIYDFHVIV